MSALIDEVIDAFIASPEGTRMWLPGLGRSMSPLLRSGDALHVERCDEAQVKRGDIALLRIDGQRLVAHFVEDTSPLRTVSLRGVPDRGALEILGRAVRLKRGGRELPLPSLVRGALLAGVEAFRGARESALIRAAYERVRDEALGKRTAALRKTLLGESTVRPLTSEDATAFIRFASDHGRLTSLFAQSRLAAAAGLTVGAFGRNGSLLGYCFADELRAQAPAPKSEVVHKLFVAPTARNLGIGEALLQACIEDARRRGKERLFANAKDADEAAHHLLAKLGFRRDLDAVYDLRRLTANAPANAYEAYQVLNLG